MKRVVAWVMTLAITITFTACGGEPDTIISGSQTIVLSPSSSSQQPPLPESPPAGDEPVQEGTEPATPAVTKPMPAEIRAVWFSYLELEGLMKNKTEKEFRNSLAERFANCADFGLNTVIFHVRPFGDAIYPSQIFPTSYLFTGEEGAVGQAPFDALAVAVQEAKRHNLRLEAWINPYRVRLKGDKALHSQNPAHELLASGDAVKMGEVFTYNPASDKARQLIVDGVVEIVKNYDVDAIHFDDYFYPTTDATFDADHYTAYKESGGSKELAVWRRDNVTTLIRMVHEAIKSTKPSVKLGISPQGNMNNNLNAQFVDVESIIKANIIDYICPQMYFGFQNGGTPYQSTIEDFNRMAQGSNVEVYVGLCTYKFNKVDTWAGAGKDEWIGCTDLLTRQVSSARKLQQYGGFVLYRYDSTFDGPGFYSNDNTAQSQLLDEMQNLKQIL